MSTSLPSQLQTALASEHAAVYLLAAFISRTSPGRLADALSESYDFHRAARDLLAERLAALGDTAPPGAAPAYDLPALSTSTAVSRAALALEQRAAAGYADLVAGTTGADRTQAIAWLSATAVRQLHFGAAPADLPGIS